MLRCDRFYNCTFSSFNFVNELSSAIDVSPFIYIYFDMSDVPAAKSDG